MPQGATLIDFYLHPPIGLLTLELDRHGPHTGNKDITQWSSTPGPIFTNHPVSASYGIYVQLNGLIFPTFGYETGWVSADGQYDEARYENRLAQVVIQHQFVGGAWVTTQLLDVHSVPRCIFWDVALPGRIGLLTAPGLSFDFFFLVGA